MILWFYQIQMLYSSLSPNSALTAINSGLKRSLFTLLADNGDAGNIINEKTRYTKNY